MTETASTRKAGARKGLKIERPVVDVTPEETEQRLQQVAESARPYVAVERGAQMP